MALDGRLSSAPPTVSIIINTDGRAQSLANTLSSLLYLRYPAFEVVVVTGPTEDGTQNVLAAWRGRIKIGHCPERNLSRSRNIGIALSSGDVVAFLDDDAIPEPEWLQDIMPAFEDEKVAVAGGFLHDHTGKGYQWTFGTANRFGRADPHWTRPAPEYNFPLSFTFPHVMANSAFRRSALIDVGGFDEEYEYFLDETDTICRLVDRGWRVAQLGKGYVHHKFMASTIRTARRALKSRYSVLKNTLYFMLMNARSHVPISEILAEMQKFVAAHRRDVAWCIGEGLLPHHSAAEFEAEQERAWTDGLEHGLKAGRRLPDAKSLIGQLGAFLRLSPLKRADEQRCFVFSTASYPPGAIGGIGRYVHHLARAIALCGHQVHVITRTGTHDRVDFEDGVWVHRLVVRDYSAVPRPEWLARVPAHIWNYSRTLLEETKEISTRRRVDCVVTPIWDVEGIAFLMEPSISHVVSLHTSLDSYLDSNPHKRSDTAFMRDFGEPMLEAERRLLTEAPLLLANSQAIIDEIQRAYGLALRPERCAVVPHGIDDWSRSLGEPPPALPQGSLRFVFVGRLEPRKGVDVLFEVAPEFLRRHPHVWLDLVGDDTIEGPEGRTWRAICEARWPSGDWRQRVSVYGNVGDVQLRGFYRAADAVVAPSRFESFGLVHLEAMMYSKPVIGCRAGGMTELIDDGITGLLAEPGDAASLAGCLEQLAADDVLRGKLGAAARQAYLDHFTAMTMARSVLAVLANVANGTSTEQLERAASQ